MLAPAIVTEGEMQDVLAMVAALRRPVMLVQAARFGLGDYRRAAHLPRLLGEAGVPDSSAAVLLRLIEIEAALDARRRARAADYRAARHVAVLVALMSEARDLRVPGPCEPQMGDAQTKASGIDSFLRAT